MGQRKSGFQRKDGDEYMTPEWVVETLCHVVPMFGNVWEPACGEGTIAKFIQNNFSFCTVQATDINARYVRDTYSIRDFLAVPVHAWGGECLTIVTNPPYGKGGKLAEAFVRHAHAIASFEGRPKMSRVCMLLPVAWDAGKTRQDLFEEFPYHITKITLTERIRWTNLPQSKNGPSENHAWFVWDWSRKGRDQRWLGRIEEIAA